VPKTCPFAPEWTADCVQEKFSIIDRSDPDEWPIDGSAFNTLSSCEKRMVRGVSWGPEYMRVSVLQAPSH
jgi:hypothetical protein